MRNFVSIITSDFQSLTKLSTKVKLLLVGQLIFLLAVSITIGLLFSPHFNKNSQLQVNENQNMRSDKNEKIRFKISPVDQITSVGKETTYSVIVQGQDASAIDMVITYDPEYLEVTSLENGDIFDNEIVNSIEKNMVSFSAGHSIGHTRPESSFVLAEFTVKALKKTPETKVQFDTHETFAFKGDKDITGGFENAVIRILDK